MATTTLANSQWSLEIVPTAGTVGPSTNHPNVLSFQARFFLWRSQVPIDTLAIVRTAPGSNAYTWQFSHDDGRVWEQTATLGNQPSQTLMTFDVQNQWSLFEIGEAYEEVRDNLLKLLIEFEIDRIDVTWLA